MPATPGHVGLAAEPAFGADLAGDAGHLAGEAVELVDHRVERFLELKDFAAHVDRDLARQVAAGDRGRDLGDVADLRGEVARHRVDAVGQVFPGAGDAGHLGLAAELAVGADLAGDAGHLGGEGVELVDHRVDGLFELQDFAADVDRDLFRQVALRHRGRDLGDVAHLRGEVARHRVDAVGQVLPGAGDAAHHRLAAELAVGADFAGDAGHFRGERVELVHRGVDGFLELKDLALDVDRDLLRQVAVRHRGRHFGDVADLGGEVARHRVDAVGQVLPGAGDAEHVGLAAEPAFGADLAGDARHFAGEHVELVDHGVHGLLELQDFAADVHRDLLGKVAAGDRRRDLGDVADLGGEVARHEVDVVGEVLPGAGDAGHLRLAAELAFGADFAGDAGHFRGEGVELVHHRVDGVLELEDFAAHVDRDLARKVAARDGGRHLGDVAHLIGEVAAHRVDGVGEVLPGAGDAGDDGLAAELAFGADLAGDAGHLRGERAQLVHHRVDGFLELQNLAAHVDGDLLGEVAVGHRDGDVGDVADLESGDVAHLVSQVAAHRIDGVGQVLPRPGDAGDDGLAAELAFGADLAGDARHLRGERTQLVDHRVDGFLELQNLAAHVDGDLLGEVAIGDGDGDVGDIANLRGQVARHGVHALGEVLPDAGHLADLGLAAELAFGADLAGDARHLRGEHVELLDHRVDDGRGLEKLALQRPPVDVERDRLQEVALGDGGDRARHRHGRPQQVVDQGVDGILHLAPGAVRQAELDAVPRFPFAPDLVTDAFQLLRDPLVGCGDLVEVCRPNLTRCRDLPSRPTSSPTRSSCCAIR